jgi:D-alanyl-D-alanine carboxypeptidase
MRKTMTGPLACLVAATAALTLTPATAHAGAEHGHGPGAGFSPLLNALVESDAATAALLRYDDGRRSWSGSAGTADLDTGAPARPDGHFRIGSVTKTFAATVVLQLAEDGLLDLDDPIERHLPGLVPDGERITVRHLLGHTSGLYDYMSEPGYSTNRWRGDDRFDGYTPRELLDVAFAHDPYFEDPGSRWRYSNTNYVVVGLLIEEVTGRTYGEEVEDRVLRPLRMRHTSLPGHDSGLPRPHARGYTQVDGETVDATEMNPSLDWAAGEMISTTRDLNTFTSALLDGDLLEDASLAEMRTAEPTGDIFAYGLGLQRFDLPCGESVYGHGGELLGYETYTTGADDGRTLTLSYNPSTRPATEQDLIPIFTEAYCPQ